MDCLQGQIGQEMIVKVVLPLTALRVIRRSTCCCVNKDQINTLRNRLQKWHFLQVWGDPLDKERK